MTAPLRAFSTDFGRFYAHPASGVQTAMAMADAVTNPDFRGLYAPNPSVTNIIGVMDEGFLPRHYAKLVAEHAVAHMDAVRADVIRFGPTIAAGALKAVVNAPHPNAAIGDNVHDAIDAHHSGRKLPEFETITARRMFTRYQEFLGKFRPEVLRTEYTVWSYVHGYAGTGDLLWHFDGKTWVIDTKSGTNIYPKVALQCAAIAEADVILEADGTESVMPPSQKIGVLHLRPMSARLYELQHPGEAFEAFLGLKACFDWQRFWKLSTIPDAPALEVAA